MTSFSEPVIVGTGPSGVAVASALIAEGIRPVMLDGGIVADESALAQRRSALHAARAQGNRLDAVGSKLDPGAKTWFGSDFATREHAASGLLYGPEVVSRASFAVGGLSRIWGGTVAFFREIDSWPAEVRPAQEDFDAVRALVPQARTTFAAVPDESEGVVTGSESSGRAMRAFVNANGDAWDVEASTVAIDTRKSSPNRCTLAGVCLDGCPSDSVWYSGDQVQRWAAAGLVRHISGAVVHTVAEQGDTVRMSLLDETGRQTIHAPRVFVAAGAISTSGLVVRSGLRDEIVLRDIATAFTAAVDLRPSVRTTAAHHGLSQWWVRAPDGAFSAQIYPPDATNARRIAQRSRLLSHVPFALGRLSRRLHPVIAYLNSDASAPLRIVARGNAAEVRATESHQSILTFRGWLTRLSKGLLHAGLWLPVFATEFPASGTGYHFGASLRHGADTDSLGRLAGMTRVHIVDASVLPALEVGSVTPTVMANAIRIGRLAARLLQTA